MNKQDVVDVVAEKTGTTKTLVQAVLDEFMGVVQDEVAAGGVVRLSGFGSFDSKKAAARTIRNPRSGEAISLPEVMKPRFVPGGTFKYKVGKT